MTPTTKGSSRSICGAFRLDLIGDVHPRLADAVEFVMDACTHGSLPHRC